jgi:hypothetical protein
MPNSDYYHDSDKTTTHSLSSNGTAAASLLRSAQFYWIYRFTISRSSLSKRLSYNINTVRHMYLTISHDTSTITTHTSKPLSTFEPTLHTTISPSNSTHKEIAAKIHSTPQPSSFAHASKTHTHTGTTRPQRRTQITVAIPTRQRLTHHPPMELPRHLHGDQLDSIGPTDTRYPDHCPPRDSRSI